jgi:two-component system nitrogen regulation response regulator NtrX
MLAREYGRRPKTFEPDALIALRQYGWPGNVRELRNVVERLMIMVPGDRVSSRDLSFLDQQVGPGTEPPAAAKTSVEVPLHEARDRFERDYILRALASQHGNISRTAELLGIERSNLYRKMRGFGIAPSRRSEDEEPVV